MSENLKLKHISYTTYDYLFVGRVTSPQIQKVTSIVHHTPLMQIGKIRKSAWKIHYDYTTDSEKLFPNTKEQLYWRHPAIHHEIYILRTCSHFSSSSLHPSLSTSICIKEMNLVCKWRVYTYSNTCKGLTIPEEGWLKSSSYIIR